MITTKKGDSVKFRIDSSCSLCKEHIEKIKEYFGSQRKDAYINEYLRGSKKGKKLGSIKITPDFNSCGHLTHWHISFIEEESK
jgi:hypothetical protein